LNLLRRLAESGAGKILDPEVQSDNPFLHNRTRTFQPHDLWEWLLRWSIVLFTLDVGIRRIQLDRQEMARVWRTARRWILFWRPEPRPAEAEESLAALLARRGQVRSTRTAPATGEARPELFRPEKEAPLFPSESSAPGEAPAGGSAPDAGDQPPQAAEKSEDSTTSRLLEAKRRALRRGRKP
jgi:hypothetical protein